MSHPPLFRPNCEDTSSPEFAPKTSEAQDNKSNHSEDSKGDDVELSLNEISEGDDMEDDQHSDSEDSQEDSNPSSGSVFNLLMKLFVYGMIATTWYLIVFYFNMPLKAGFMGTQGSEIIISILSVMASVSYFKCSSSPSDNQKQRPPYYMNIKEQNTCKPCQKWKPERSHHCRWCKKCILRMDHHCPWICNCVGYRNHKAFLLFCFYIGIGSLYFDYRVLKFFFWTPETQQMLVYSASWIIFCVICTFIIGPVGIMAFGLSIYHFCLAMNNLTTLDHIKGGTIHLPCSFSTPKKMNKYDNGKLANLAEFFGNTYLFWWWPTIATYSYKGQKYKRNDEPSQKEIDNFLACTKNVALENIKPKPTSLKEMDVGGLFRSAELFVKDRVLQFNEIKLELPKESHKPCNDKIIEERNHSTLDIEISFCLYKLYTFSK